MQISNKTPEQVTINVTSAIHKTKLEIASEANQIEAAKSDPAAFNVLYQRYHEQVFRYVYQRTGDKEISFDVTSQIFLKALTNLHKYESRGLPFGSWLFRIAQSEVYQMFRDNTAHRTVNIETKHLADLLDEFEEDHTDDHKEILVKILSELEEKELQLIEMRFFEKRAFKEIGEIVALTENNAKVKVYRIIEKMRIAAEKFQKL